MDASRKRRRIVYKTWTAMRFAEADRVLPRARDSLLERFAGELGEGLALLSGDRGGGGRAGW